MRRPLALAALLAAQLALSALLAVAPARAGDYLETFEAGKDPQSIMAGTLLLGSDGSWQGELRDGAYLLSNKGQAGGVRYFHLRQRQDAAPKEVSISVDVSGSFDGQVAGAGLLYDFGQDGKSYFAFVLGKDAHYTLWRRGPNGFQRVATGDNAAIRPDGINLLAARLGDAKAELTINGARILAHKAEGATDRAVGIIALDTGSYRFDNFHYAVQ